MDDQLDLEGLHDVECGAAIEEALEGRASDPLLQRALKRIRALEGGVGYADQHIKSLQAELSRIIDVVFPDSLPLDDALYLAIKEKFEEEKTMDLDELKRRVSSIAQIREKRLKDGQPYNTRTVGFQLTATVGADTYVTRASYLSDAYEKMAAELGVSLEDE